MATDFLRDLFGGEALTFEQLEAKIQAGKLNVVNIADGSYVSRAKFDDRVASLGQQVTDLTERINQRDADMTDLQNKFTAAQADANKFSEAQTALTTLQNKYTHDQQQWEAKSKKQAYEFMVRERAGALKFTSAAARRDFIREANAKDLKVDGEILLGYEDFVAKYKADNPGAIEEDKPETPPPAQPPRIVLPDNSNPKPEASVFGFHFNGVRPNPAANNGD